MIKCPQTNTLAMKQLTFPGLCIPHERFWHVPTIQRLSIHQLGLTAVFCSRGATRRILIGDSRRKTFPLALWPARAQAKSLLWRRAASGKPCPCRARRAKSGNANVSGGTSWGSLDEIATPPDKVINRPLWQSWSEWYMESDDAHREKRNTYCCVNIINALLKCTYVTYQV